MVTKDWFRDLGNKANQRSSPLWTVEGWVLSDSFAFHTASSTLLLKQRWLSKLVQSTPVATGTEA